MSVFNLHHHHAHSRPLFGWKNASGRGWHTQLSIHCLSEVREHMEERKYRRKLQRLLRYDDHMLEDMGLTRSELQMAVKLPITVDSRATLSNWRAERKVTG